LIDFEVREAGEGDHEELFQLYALVVEEGHAFPAASPATRHDFETTWIQGKTIVLVVRSGGRLAGSYHLVPNYSGRATHIGNAGYMVHPDFRRQGIGRALVEHSIAEAPRHGFDALMFNLVFESNPARHLYEGFGFQAVGRVPEAVEGEDAIVYWRKV
jgi:ribosomal protein S18 acetylase RimI-like enzyme